MYKDNKIGTVIPAYNEEQFIEDVIRGIPEFVDYIFVVDDASTDDTATRAKAVDDGRLMVICNPSNMGVGGSMMVGYQAAIQAGMDIIVKVDGDGQMSMSHMPHLLDAIVEEGYDYAKGNRFIEGDSLASMPRIRLVGNIILTFLTKLASGYWHVFDPQNGYTAIRATALQHLPLGRIYKGYFFENDMLVQLNIHRFRVKDVSIPAIYGDEISHLHIRKIIGKFSGLLLKRFFYRIYQRYILRDFSPIVIFGVLGLLLLGWGIAFGLITWIHSYSTGVPATTGTVMLSVLPFFIGFQLLLQALVLDIQETPK
ncbi:MAG: glycosyltransferase family 2 protein [Anaerolineae bacterium]|nr:glycosyltransferase family 2 protein [Anaerolineae bacterium]